MSQVAAYNNDDNKGPPWGKLILAAAAVYTGAKIWKSICSEPQQEHAHEHAGSSRQASRGNTDDEPRPRPKPDLDYERRPNLASLPRGLIQVAAPGKWCVGEANLTDYLVEEVISSGGKIVARDWLAQLEGGKPGVGDVVFRLNSGVDVVCEVKYLDLDATGHNACVARTKKRREVEAQAAKYREAWKERPESARDVVAAVFTNEKGLVYQVRVL